MPKILVTIRAGARSRARAREWPRTVYQWVRFSAIYGIAEEGEEELAAALE